MARTLFIHEDCDGQIELLPRSMYPYCDRELGEISRFADAHRVDLGGGTSAYSGMYVRGEPPETLDSIGVTIDELSAALDPLLPRYDELLTGYSSHRQPMARAVGWGEEGERAPVLVATHREDGVVDAIWSVPGPIAAARVARFSAALLAIPRADQMLLVDWQADALFRLTDRETLSLYLGVRSNAAGSR